MAYTRQRKIDENHIHQATMALFQQVLKDLQDGVVIGFEDTSDIGTSVWRVNMTFRISTSGKDSYLVVEIDDNGIG